MIDAIAKNEWRKSGAWPGITPADSLALQGDHATAELDRQFGIEREFINIFTDNGLTKNTWFPSGLLDEVALHVDAEVAAGAPRWMPALLDYRAQAAAYRGAVDAASGERSIGTLSDGDLMEAHDRLRRLEGAIIVFDQLGLLVGGHLAARAQTLLGARLPHDGIAAQKALESFAAATWTSSLQQEEVAVLELAARVVDEGRAGEPLHAATAARRRVAVVAAARGELEGLARRFGPLAAYLNSSAKTVADYALAVASCIGDYETSSAMRDRIDRVRQTPDMNRQRAAELAAGLHLTGDSLTVLKLLSETMATRNESAYEVSRASLALRAMRSEIGRRLGLDSTAMRVIYDDELRALLERRLAVEGIDLSARFRFSGYAHTRSGGARRFTPDEAEAIYALLEPEAPSGADTAVPPETRGVCASVGTATGRACVVHSMPAADFKKGDILIAQSATVDYVPLMTRAAGVVTEHGGIGCHAAIVARELGIPAVVGYAGATRRFSTGQIVRIDAANGVVTVLE